MVLSVRNNAELYLELEALLIVVVLRARSGLNAEL